MGLYVVEALDKADGLVVRMATREAHLAWLRGLPNGQVRLGGPLLDEAGQPKGSLLIFEAESRAAVDALLAEDPYAKAGLFAAVTVTPFRWVIAPPADLAS
jgi:uncharacterized protein YciI